MASHARATLREAYKDAAGVLNRSIPSLLVTCVSAMLLGVADDEILISGAEISAPLSIGKTRYEVFMVLAPASIIILKIYADMQLLHFRRIATIVNRHRLRRPLHLFATKNPFLHVAGFFALHVLPSFAIAFLGYHASAIYPIFAVALYAVAVLLLIWSTYVLGYGRSRQHSAMLIGISTAACIGGAALAYDADAAGYCEGRYEGALAAQVAPFLRGVELVRADFSRASAAERNMACGLFDDSKAQEGDFKHTQFSRGLMNKMRFEHSLLAYAEFFNATLKRTNFNDANAFAAEFIDANIDGSKFNRTKLTASKFNQAVIKRSDLRNSDMRFAFMNTARLSETSFYGSEMNEMEFIDSHFWKVDFSRTNLSGAHFSDSSFSSVKFDRANLTCVTFFRSSFTDTVDWSRLHPGSLRRIRLDADTRTGLNEKLKLPGGFQQDQIGSRYETDCVNAQDGGVNGTG